MRVLISGGAGYIGSHTAVLLAEAGHAYAEFLRGINLNINTFDDLLNAWNTHARIADFLRAFQYR